MTFLQAIRRCLRGYVDFSIRAGRPEFWYWILASALLTAVSIVLQIGINLLLMADSAAVSQVLATILWVVWLPVGIAGLAMIVPTFAVTSRRMRDRGLTGWLCLLWFIPCAGIIVIAALAAQEGTLGPNQYGPAPGG